MALRHSQVLEAVIYNLGKPAKYMFACCQLFVPHVLMLLVGGVCADVMQQRSPARMLEDAMN